MRWGRISVVFAYAIALTLRACRGLASRSAYFALFSLLLVGFGTLGSPRASALSCPSFAVADPSKDILFVTYYLTATSCQTTEPVSGLLLSATIDDAFAKVTFPGPNTVASSVTTGTGCDETFSTTAGNVAAYSFGASATCSVSIKLTNGGAFSFVALNASDKLALSVSSVNLVGPGLPKWTVSASPAPSAFTGAGQDIKHSFTLTNTGNVQVSNITLAGTNTGAISCPTTSLAVGASTICTSTYKTQAGDVGSPIAYDVTAKGIPAGGSLADATTNGTIAFSALPALAITMVTPTPANFTAAGQNIAFSYTLTNTGNVQVSNITVAGTNTGAISCALTVLPAGGSTTCSSVYKTTVANMGTDIAYSATPNGVPTAGTLAVTAATGAITFTAQPALTLATAPSPTMYSKVGEVITHTYTLTNTGNVPLTSLAVTDTKATGISCAATTLALGATTACNGTYTITGADILAKSVSSTATANGLFGTTTVTSPPVATTLQLDADAIRKATQEAIRGFLHRRAEIITSSEPNHARKHERLSGSLFGGSSGDAEDAGSSNPPPPMRMGRQAEAGPPDESAGGRFRSGIGPVDGVRSSSALPFGFDGNADDGTGRFAFATSLSKMLQTSQSEKALRDGGQQPPMALGGPGRSPATKDGPLSRLDIWAEGMMSYYSDTALGPKQKGHAALLYTGVDYRIHPAILIGALVQLDWISETGSPFSVSASGKGWMAGPYASIRLTPNLFFDARAAWGRSDNRIDPFGIYTDSFETERGLVSGKLTGNWSYGQLKLRPSAEVVYFHEVQQAYSNQLSILIPEQSISLGRLIVGPEVGYQFKNRDGITFEPYVGVKGVWDFAKTGDPTVAGLIVGNDPFHAKVEVGAIYTDPSGASLRGSLSYDGIGDSSFQAYHGRVSVTIPFN